LFLGTQYVLKSGKIFFHRYFNSRNRGTFFIPLPSGTRATFFLTAVGQIKHTEEGDISREKDDPDDVTAAREGRRR
jgi:hypothetical protein